MAIKIVMLIFIILLVLTSWYMWHRRSGHFLIYDIGGHPELERILKWSSIALAAESILGIIILYFSNKYMNLITLALGSLTILIFSLLFSKNS